MIRLSRKALVLGGVAVIAAAGFAGVAYAQGQSTPKNWNYEIKDGKRVPKGNRVTNADGSWREEVRQGNCVTIKEKHGERRVSRNSPVQPEPEAACLAGILLNEPSGRLAILHAGTPVPGRSLQSRTCALPSGPAKIAQSRPSSQCAVHMSRF